jgi:predicted ribosomally synthesized peptide with SipW-like signal peptide
MKKTGIIMLALVVALGALGVGYAMWSDTVTVNGTVTTGSVDIDIESVSHTYVYKCIKAYGEYSVADIIFSPTPMPLNPVIEDPGPQENELLYVASAVTSAVLANDPAYDEDAEVATIVFDNIFPTTTANISGDVVLHYVGSIPAHVKLTNISYTAIDGVDLTPYLNVEWFWDDSDDDPDLGYVKVASPEALQLHYCDRVMVVINFDLEQIDEHMNCSGTFTGTVMVHQWNEEPTP